MALNPLPTAQVEFELESGKGITFQRRKLRTTVAYMWPVLVGLKPSQHYRAHILLKKIKLN